MTDQTRDVDLLARLWRWRVALVTAVVLGALIGYGVSLLQPVRYTAESRVFLSATSPFTPLDTRSNADPERFVVQQAELMVSQPVLAGVDRGLGADPANVQATPSADSNVVVVAATADTPERAVQLADAVPAAYRDFMSSTVAQTAGRALAASTDPATAAQVRTAGAVYGDGISLVEPAELPVRPSAPVPLRNALLLAVLGCLAVIVAALSAVGRTRAVATQEPTSVDVRDQGRTADPLPAGTPERPAPAADLDRPVLGSTRTKA